MQRSFSDPALAVTDDIKADFKNYFEQSDHGGALHLLLESSKFDTRTVERSLREANIEEDMEGIRLCKILVKLSMTDRAEILKDYI